MLIAAGGRQASLWDFGRFEPHRPVDNTAWDVRGPSHGYYDQPETDALSPDGRRLAVARNGRVRLFDVMSGLAIGEPVAYRGRADELTFAADGRSFAFVYLDRPADDKPGPLAIQRVDAQTARPLGAPLKVPPTGFGKFDPTLHWAAIAGFDEKGKKPPHLVLWDLIGGKPGASTRSYDGNVDLVTFSRDGQRFLTRSGDELRAWDTVTGALVGPAFTQTGFYGTAEFTPDGERLLVGYSATLGHWGDGRARMWDVRAGRVLFELPVRGVASEGFVLSPDGTRIATAGGRAGRVWDAGTGKPLTPPMRHGHELQAVTFSNDGRVVMTTGLQYTTQLWDAATGDLLTPPLPGERFPILTDDRRLLMYDDAILVYDLRPDERSIDELRLLAQALSGNRIDDTGGYVPLAHDEHDAVWRRLRTEFPYSQPMTPERERAWHASRAESCEHAERWIDVITHLTPLIDAQPHRCGLWARRGRAYFESGEWDKAIADLNAAVELGAEDPSVWLDRGHCHAEQGRFREAAADFARAAASRVQNVEPLQALALLAAGDRDGYRTIAARILDYLKSKAEEFDPIEMLAWPLVLPAGEKFDLTKPIALLEQTVAAKDPDVEDLRTLGPGCCGPNDSRTRSAGWKRLARPSRTTCRRRGYCSLSRITATAILLKRKSGSTVLRDGSTSRIARRTWNGPTASSCDYCVANTSNCPG